MLIHGILDSDLFNVQWISITQRNTAKDCRKMLNVKFVFWGQKLRKAPQQYLRRCEWNKALSDS